MINDAGGDQVLHAPPLNKKRQSIPLKAQARTIWRACVV
jgi:hypothetical protein